MSVKNGGHGFATQCLYRKLVEIYDRNCQVYGYIKWEYQITVKHYLKEENEVNENKILSYCEVLTYM